MSIIDYLLYIGAAIATYYLIAGFIGILIFIYIFSKWRKMSKEFDESWNSKKIGRR